MCLKGRLLLNQTLMKQAHGSVDVSGSLAKPAIFISEEVFCELDRTNVPTKSISVKYFAR